MITLGWVKRGILEHWVLLLNVFVEVRTMIMYGDVVNHSL